ncbi:MAG: restriction endonuclease subunit S [Ekhidna sp.]|nr:restriction endonuclease subunit S [Ekhidna sp.]
MQGLAKISDLFEITYGVNLELVNMSECEMNNPNAIPFVSRTEKNNGISAFVEEEIDINTSPAHTLSVAVSGSVLSTFYQPKKYYTGFHIFILMPKIKMSVIEMLFYAKCINFNKYRYNYGRQANKTLKELLIPSQIPSKTRKHLDLYFKEQLNLISQKSFTLNSISLNSTKWRMFKLTDLFTITGSKTTPLLELEEYGTGGFSYVTTQSTNNGVEGFYDFSTEEGNVLTVDSAVLGYCSYQELNFSASDHVEKLIPKFDMNEYVAMFLVTIINLERYRYNYGRKCSQARMKEINIKLPSKNSEPDFEFMEDYIKTLPYSSSIKMKEIE